MEIKKDTQYKLIEFIDVRHWNGFHTEENLAKAISIESSELLENYLWGEDWHIDEQNKKDEIADILIYCFYYLQKMGWDADKLVNEKIIKNAKKYNTEEYHVSEIRRSEFKNHVKAS